MKASDYIAHFLRQQGVEWVYEMSGGMITHMLDSICQIGGIRIVSTHHEQCAAFAAEASGRMTGVPGVAMATSGPGATNLVTAIGSCYFDSVPTVFITGQVNRHEQKKDKAIRQLGFQETDIVAMVKPITKAAWLVNSPEELPALLAKAFATAMEGRPGPVLLDIPMDVQRVDLNIPEPVKVVATPLPEPADTDDFIKELLAGLQSAQRPLILAGGGVRSALCIEAFRQVVDQFQVPVVHSLMAVDVLPYDHPLRIGLIGSYGNRWANHAIGSSDFLLVLGSRLDVRQTGADVPSFKGERSIFHIDCEAGELNNRVTGCRTLQGELNPFLLHLKAAAAQALPERKSWLADLRQLQTDWPDTWELRDFPGINPNAFIHALSQQSKSASAFVVDVGQHQMWAAQSVELGPDQRFLTSGGMGSMGFALPSAIGASFSSGMKPVVLVAGDGGFQSNIQELQTIRRDNLPIKLAILNNECHGMVRQFQESYFEGRYQSTLWGYSAPDFSRVAEAYGIPSKTIVTHEEMDEAVKWMWSIPGPCLLQVMIDTHTNAYPKMAFGKPMTEMEPLAQPLDMEAT